MNANVQAVCNDLISAFLGGGAQGLAIIGLIWVFLRLCWRANAATRHAAWFATLLVVAALPAILFWTPLASKVKASLYESSFDHSLSATPLAVVDNDEIAPASDLVPSETHAIESLPIESVVEIDPEPEAPIGDAKKPFDWQFTVPKYLSLTLLSVWLVLASIRLASLLKQLWDLRCIKRRAVIAPAALAAPFAQLVKRMGISRRPSLLISEEAAAPMVVGFIRPAMLLPRYIAAQSGGLQMQHLFRHELGHLARRDDWTNLIQQAIAAVLFFHPGVLFLSRRLTAEREIACDDHALAISAPREYALFLTEFASRMKGRQFTAAPAAWSSKSQLKERIGMILDGKRNASPRVSRTGVGTITAATLALALLSLAATPRLVFATDEPAEPAIEAIEAVVATEVETSLEALEPIEVAVAVEPIQLEALAIEPDITIASVVSGPREKIAIKPPRVNVNVNALQPAQLAQPGQPSRRPVAVAVASPAPKPDPVPKPASAPRPKRVAQADSDDDDHDDAELHRRIERLERKVDELLRKGPGKDAAFPRGNPPNDEIHAHMRAEMERAQRDADRARRDAERAMREQKMAMEQKHSAEHKHAIEVRINEDKGREMAKQSFKARRQALESQRKQIDKELQSLDKEMQREEQAYEKRKEADEQRKEADERRKEADEKRKEAEKRIEKEKKEKEKAEKKTRDLSGDDSDEDSKKKAQQ